MQIRTRLFSFCFVLFWVLLLGFVCLDLVGVLFVVFFLGGATEVLTAFSSFDLWPHKLVGGGSGVQGEVERE